MADRYSYQGAYGTASLTDSGIKVGFSWGPVLITLAIVLLILCCCSSSSFFLKKQMCQFLSKILCFELETYSDAEDEDKIL